MVFLFVVLPGFVAFDTTLVLSTNIGVGLDTLIPIDIRWCQSITDSMAEFFSAVNLSPNVEVCTVVWNFDEHVVGVDPTTENNLVIDLTVTFSFPWSASTNTWMSNSLSRGLVNCSSIYSLKYAYLFPK